MTRWKAGALHLGASVAVFAIIASAFLLLWVPPSLWSLAGVQRPLLILFAAVLVVGPLLTALVYRSGKATLRSDLIVVVLIQVVFLGYALSMLARTRPVFTVATKDRLQLVLAHEIDRGDLVRAKSRYRRLSWTGPRLVGVRAPSPAPLFTMGDEELPLRPDYYVEYAVTSPGLRQRSKPLETLMARSGDDRRRVQRALAALGREATQVRFVPITSLHGAAVMLIDAGSATPLQLLPMNPWVGVEAAGPDAAGIRSAAR